LFTLLLSLLSFQSHGSITAMTWTPQPSPASAGAMAVHLTADGDDLIMSWLEPSGRHSGKFMAARLRDGQWLSPSIIHESDRLFINWADIPRVLFGKRLSIAVWPEMIGTDTYAYGLRFRTSRDGGKTWGPSKALHEDQQPKEHGFVSLASLDESTIAAIWLDGREMGGGHGEPGSMQLRYREITPQGVGSEEVLDGMTCECCGTDLVVIDGQPAALYRNRSEAHIRDIQWVHRKPSGDWPKPMSFPGDEWEIHGCPVNGPAMVHQGSTTVAAWFTMADGQSKIRLATKPGSAMAWKDWGAMGQQPLGRVALAFLDNHHFILAWLESGDGADLVYYAVFNQEKSDKPVVKPTKLEATGKGRASGFPKLASIGGTCYLAYQGSTESGIKIQKMEWRPPQP